MKPQYFWLAMGFILMTAEVVTPGFILFFFGLAAVLVGVVCFIFPYLSETWQLLLFAVLSIVTMLTMRKQMKALFTGRSRADGAEIDDACVGQHAVVTARIATPVDGKVELDGTSWTATSAEVLEAGVQVEVMGRDGLTLTVRRRV